MPRLAGRMTSCQDGVDKLGWNVGATYACHGVRVGFRAKNAAALAQLVSWLPRAMTLATPGDVPVLYSYLEGGAAPGSKVKRFHILYRNFLRVARSLDLDDLRSAFGRDLNMYIGEHASRRIFVHAGVVAIDGAAVLIPGKSFSGKTTLTRALVDRGGVYFSDEYAVLDSRGNVSPWAEPLSIRKNGARESGEKHSAESLGMQTGRGSLPVRLVVMTSFKEGQRFKPRTVTPGAGALGLLEHTLPARRRPEAALKSLASAVTGARILHGPRGDAAKAADAIVRYLATPRSV
ncbi:MAG: hypothetical protein ABI672_12980 [Vicinamibacteria bacterium]